MLIFIFLIGLNQEPCLSVSVIIDAVFFKENFMILENATMPVFSRLEKKTGIRPSGMAIDLLL